MSLLVPLELGYRTELSTYLLQASQALVTRTRSLTHRRFFGRVLVVSIKIEKKVVYPNEGVIYLEWKRSRGWLRDGKARRFSGRRRTPQLYSYQAPDQWELRVLEGTGCPIISRRLITHTADDPTR